MGARKLWCWLYDHKWSRWERSKVTTLYQRTCERCREMEVDAKRTPYARKRAVLRAPNESDTIGG